MYPAIENIPRKCENEYKIPGTNLTIPAETLIMIPISAIHNDPEIYPEPEKFDPERFSSENKQQRYAMAHIPFGDGPRNCIGVKKLSKIRTLRTNRLNFSFDLE